MNSAILPFIRHEKLARVDAVERHAPGWRRALDQLAALPDMRGDP
jgi:hypothetical protein